MTIMVTKTKLRNKADTLWSEIIKSTGYCEKCGRTNVQLHPHHVIGRRNLILRWDLWNGICLCSGCHTMGIGSAHQDSLGFLEWYKNKYPDRYEYLREKKNFYCKRTLKDYEGLIKDLKLIREGKYEFKV
jgi:hypothetical protein